MDVREIVKAWLKSQGYDGLYTTYPADCACGLDELMHCYDERSLNCLPACKIQKPMGIQAGNGWFIPAKERNNE